MSVNNAYDHGGGRFRIVGGPAHCPGRNVVYGRRDYIRTPRRCLHRMKCRRKASR